MEIKQSEPDQAPAENGVRFKGAKSKHVLDLSGRRQISYQASADWIHLLKRDRRAARMFHAAYIEDNQRTDTRPITFVFNGGPGAASAYLHMGALGPQRVQFSAEGATVKPPVELLSNQESWLEFSDLVFIDPIGTGFSRVIVDEKDAKPHSSPSDEKKKEAEQDSRIQEDEYWEVERDLNSIAEFIQQYLSQNNRWNSPIFIAGESYGGFRVAKLARRLQEKFGVGLNGAILISPAIEFASLFHNDYDVIHWIETLPSLAATAYQHKRIAQSPPASLSEFLREVEAFSVSEYCQFLVQGDLMPERQQQEIIARLSQFLAMPPELLRQLNGRIPIGIFARELLREQRLVCGLYDASITAVDPFPDRLYFEGPDPTLYSIDRVYSAGINSHLRSTLGVETDLHYYLLNEEVNTKWKRPGGDQIWNQMLGAMDDLRYALSLNPFMQVFLCHGYFDLVTPYFSSHRLTQHMKLHDSQRESLHVKHYPGGHMFYSWDSSREEFTQDIRGFYARSLRQS